jgi:hypothetical protein
LLTPNSIGFRGGSIVRNLRHSTIGSDRVGYRIQKEALIFGGKTATATDFTVLGENNLKIGNSALVKGALDSEDIDAYREAVKIMLEKIIDTIKTRPEDLPVLLVGYGAVIAPDTLKGSK